MAVSPTGHARPGLAGVAIAATRVAIAAVHPTRVTRDAHLTRVAIGAALALRDRHTAAGLTAVALRRKLKALTTGQVTVLTGIVAGDTATRLTPFETSSAVSVAGAGRAASPDAGVAVAASRIASGAVEEAQITGEAHRVVSAVSVGLTLGDRYALTGETAVALGQLLPLHAGQKASQTRVVALDTAARLTPLGASRAVGVARAQIPATGDTLVAVTTGRITCQAPIQTQVARLADLTLVTLGIGDTSVGLDAATGVTAVAHLRFARVQTTAVTAIGVLTRYAHPVLTPPSAKVAVAVGAAGLAGIDTGAAAAIGAAHPARFAAETHR